MKTLDARTLPSTERHPQIFRTFDELGAGERFILINDHYPKPLLYQFLFERRGQFEWNVLRGGPGVFRVEIEKRAAPGARGVSGYLQTDHARLDAIVAKLEGQLEAGDLTDARPLFDELACGLERHMLAEENVLFPAFERVTGMMGGPVPVMHQEHAELRALLGRISDALAAGDADTAGDALDEAVQLLRQHNMKEEHIIYPRTDQALGEQAREALVDQMLTL